MPTLRYELVDGTHNKFWQIEHPHAGDDKQYRRVWGAIGTKGQESVSRYQTAEEAKKELARTIRDKEQKGYVLAKGGRKAAKEAATGPGHTKKGIKAGGGFAVQLLQKWDGKTVPEHAATEPKIDGVRAVFVFAGKRFCCYSRKGNTFNNVMSIAAELMQNFDGYCLDGELVSKTKGMTKEALNATIHEVQSDERGDAESDIYFAAFDCLTHEELDTKTCRRTLIERRALMEKLWPKCTTNSGVVIQSPVSAPKDVKRDFGLYRKAGFEGAVLKDLETPYVFTRAKTWVKIKDKDTGDYKIVECVEGKGRLFKKAEKDKMLGKFMVKGPKGKLSGVGGGFTDAQRKEFWRRRKDLIGKTAEVEFQEVTSDGALRNPVFVRLRDDK